MRILNLTALLLLLSVSKLIDAQLTASTNQTLGNVGEDETEALMSNQTDRSHGSRRMKRSIPKVYVKILLLFDFSFFAYMKGNKSVTHDVLYRCIRKVHDNFQSLGVLTIYPSIAEAIYPKLGEEVLIPRSDLKKGQIHTETAFKIINRFVEKGNFMKHDIVVVLTRLPIISENSTGAEVEVKGQAPLSGICKTGKNIAIIRHVDDDEASYIATRQIIRLFGVPWDGEKGAESCNKKNREYIMKNVDSYKGNEIWSRCSSAMVNHALSSGQLACVYRSPVKKH